MVRHVNDVSSHMLYLRNVNDVLSFYSLSYKYHRLIDASQMKDGELPPSEKCALEADEEEEDEVSL